MNLRECQRALKDGRNDSAAADHVEVVEKDIAAELVMAFLHAVDEEAMALVTLSPLASALAMRSPTADVVDCLAPGK